MEEENRKRRNLDEEVLRKSRSAAAESAAVRRTAEELSAGARSARRSAPGGRSAKSGGSASKSALTRQKELHREAARQWIEDERARKENKQKRITESGRKKLLQKQIPVAAGIILALALLIVLAEKLIPGSYMKKKEMIDDTPVEEKVEIIPERAYEETDVNQQRQIVWDTLEKHFEGNETAVLGIMCNLEEESRFRAANLEDYNNQIWNIDDAEYTEKVNRRTIDKRDFLESRKDDVTNGYYNSYDQWVNLDGGYGFAQYTAYDQKEELYLFAEQWFGPGGKGEKKKFNIADAEMQANFLVHLLESDSYSWLDRMLRNAETVADACYEWLCYYEVAYDPYCDNYYTLAFERAEVAEEIREACAGLRDGAGETKENGAGETKESGDGEDHSKKKSTENHDQTEEP